MKKKTPRHPVIVIGAGIAGLTAAFTLEEQGIPALVLEGFDRPGGRFNSRKGEGWLADHGTQYFKRSDDTICGLVRSLGLDTNRVSVQGGVHELKGNGEIVVPKGGGVDLDRLCLDIGFSGFMEELAARVSVVYNSAVGGVRWDNDQKTFWWEKEGQVFWFVDEKGEAIRNPETREPFMGSGLILATTPTAANRIARRSRSLEGLVPLLSSVEHDSCFTAIYKVPKVKKPFYALKGDPECKIAWLALEDRKAPERISSEFSLLVVQASPRWSEDLMYMKEHEALQEVYTESRHLIPELPENPISQTYKRWKVARPTSEPLGFPDTAHWPTNPEHLPFALAGDYLLGDKAEHAARSGVIAAKQILNLLPERRNVLGLELPS